jgi:hypothetical protein
MLVSTNANIFDLAALQGPSADPSTHFHRNLVGRQSAMALVHRLGQRVGNAGTHADHGGFVDAELHRDGIGGLEPDATDIAGQAIGVLRHDLHGIAAVGLVDAHRPRGADP